jgi:serine/threonine protein kinase/Tfp pilus assembly protein PilF
MTGLNAGTKLGPYEILAQIGAGGMGEVWKAKDTRLGRIVAIKKVKEQHSERFKQEARSIAALNHPFICQIHDIGPDYLVLEYVEGKPLSSPLPEKEAVRLAMQIATALEEAHQKGIIHRDLKPLNIMVTDKGSVKLLDFGLAKLYEQDASSSQSPTADSPATQAGAVLGTVAYMSPEQAQGQPADERSDIFSFGLLLYEMLSGRRAFSGDSNFAVMTAIVKEDPPPMQASPSLEKIVRCCLAKQASGRYQTISEVRMALEQAVETKTIVGSSEPQPSIAVLPFVNMSGDKEQEYFSDGLAEDIIDALTQLPGLRVMARTSAFAFRGKEQDIREIGARLNVENILEGSVRKAGNRLRITAQLIKASDGYHLWSQRFDREITDIFAIQDEISQAIADKLRVRLSGERQPLKRHTQNVEAYNLYLKGRHQFYRATLESYQKSIQFYEQAIALDSDYALAWYGLAKCFWWTGYAGLMPPKTANAQASQALDKALDLQETLPEAHAMLGMLRGVEYDPEGAEREFRIALDLSPKSDEVLINYAWFLLCAQRLDEAFSSIQKALELDPLSLILQHILGLYHYYRRQWDEAINRWRISLDLDASNSSAYQYLSQSYIQKGMIDEGIRAAETLVELYNRIPLVLGILGWAYAKAGRNEDARKVLEELQNFSRKAYALPSAFAWIYLALEEIDHCLDYMEKAVEESDQWIFHMVQDSSLYPLHSHPRYHALLRKINLEP